MENWDNSEIYHERLPYFEDKSTLEEKEDLGDGCSPRNEYDDEDIPIDDNLCDTPTCFERIMSWIWECASSYHETKYSEGVEYLEDHLQ